MVNHSTLCRSINYDYMNILTWAILKKTQKSNGCETFAFKYINKVDGHRVYTFIHVNHIHNHVTCLNILKIMNSLDTENFEQHTSPGNRERPLLVMMRGDLMREGGSKYISTTLSGPSSACQQNAI